MTPSELNKIKSAVAQAAAGLLARDSNAETTAESLAEELADSVVEAMITKYEEIQAKSYNLVIVSSFRLPDGDVHTAAVGPLSTRAKQRARDVGERFAWDYKSRRGEGRYTLVPLVRNPSEAWDEARRAGLDEYVSTLGSITKGTEPTYEPMRLDLDEAVRGRITADWQMDPEILRRKSGPACVCGLDRTGELVCPRHPEERRGDGPSAGS